ncbi:MAG: hypothetical protein IKK66_03245 [Ruminococcus sp.]|nr:hypothetical protein [Ruminococcus sp.]
MKVRIKTKSYVISVSLGTGCYRHIRISGKATLEELSDAILDAFDFDNDHLHAFFMNNRAWDEEDCYYSPYAEEDEFCSTDSCKLQFINLEIGKKFLYIFDFGDDWRFQCKVLNILDEDTKEPVVVRTKGAAPMQYPEFDEDDEFYNDDEYFDDEDGYFDDDEEITELEKPLVPVPDELYDTALRFKKVKLWNKLYDTDIFAVKLSNGEIGYCSITGNSGEYYALSLYIGEKGLSSYYRILDPQYIKDDEALFECMISQECLQICFDNKDGLRLADLNSVQDYAKRNGVNLRGAHSYPAILRMKSYYMPWYVEDKKEYELLREALEAAIFVSEKLKGTSAEKLGFTESSEIPYLVPNGDSFDWQTVQLPNETAENFPTPSLSKSKVSELKALKQLNKWECKVIYIKKAGQDAPDDAPYFPTVMIAIECRNNHILPVEPVRDYDINAQIMLDSFADELLKYKRLPKTICVSDDRTYSLLQSFCKDCGVELKIVDAVAKADDIAYKMNYASESDEFDSLLQTMEILDRLSVDELKTMPSELKTVCIQMIDDGLLEPDLEAKLKRAFNIK